MLTLPDAIVPVLNPFATLFRSPTWRKAQILLVGAILAPGQRTVAAALRLSDDRNYARYHQVLNRAVWSPREVARILLLLLLQHLDQGDGPLIFGIDETLERRRGPKIKSLGMYRDAVRSSRSQVVKASGLRWISLMWLGQVPWAGRYWALPFLTVLAPSARYYRQRGRHHKKLTDWARQMVLQLRRWLPQRSPVLVGDGGYAVLDLLHCCQSLAQPVTLIARLRLDAALYEPAPPGQPGQNGRPPLKGRRLPALKALWTCPPCHGSRCRQPGTTALPARWNSPRKLRSGTARASHPCPSAGSWFGTPRVNSPHRLCCALTWPWTRCRYCSGIYCGGNWSDLPGSASASGRGDPTPVVGSRHRPHHANPDGALLLDHPGGSLDAGTTAHEPSHSGLVRQAVSNLRRCHRPGAPPLVAGVGGFFTVRRRTWTLYKS